MLKIAISKLNNDQLYTFGLRTVEIISPRPVTEMGIEMFFNNFKEKFGKYEEAKEQLSANEKVLKGKDRIRDIYFNNMEDHFENYLHYPDQEIKEQVESLLGEINKHGPQITKRRYTVETAILQNIIAKIEAEYMGLVDKTNNVWFNLLVEAQVDFENSVHELSNEKAERNKIASPSNLRPELEEAIRKLLAFLPMQYELTQNKDLGEILEQLEVAHKRF